MTSPAQPPPARNAQPPARNAQPPARNAHRLAREAHAAGRLDEAARLYLQAVAETPDSAAAAIDYAQLVLDHVPLAVAAQRADRLDRAMALYRRILSVQPAYPGVLHMIGLILRRHDRLLDGLDWMGRALRLDARTEGASGNLNTALDELFARATAARAAGRIHDALALTARAARAAPDHPRAGLEHAVMTWRAGDTAGALDLAQALGRRSEAEARVARALSHLTREGGPPQDGDRAGRGVVETARVFGALRAYRRPPTRVLVVVEGDRHRWMWGQIALAFHRQGCRVTLLDLAPGRFRLAAGEDAFFDLVILNQRAMNDFYHEALNTPEVDWTRHFHALAILQFHDVCTELLTLARANEFTRRYGFQIRYWACCQATEMFLRKHFPRFPVFFQPQPVSAEELVLFDERFGGTLPALTLNEETIGRTASHLAGGRGRERPGTESRAVYFGAFETSLTFALNPDARLAPAEVAELGRLYRARTARPTRVGFIDWLIDDGRVGADADAPRALRDLGEYLWTYAATVIEEERGRPLAMARERFGASVDIVGDGWGRLGLEHRPPDFAAWPFTYARARVCVDFGSQYIDSCLYLRTLQIIAFGGRLLQRRRHDSDLVFGEHAATLCFDDDGDLLARLDGILGEPAPGEPAPNASQGEPAWRRANAALLANWEPRRVATAVLARFFDD